MKTSKIAEIISCRSFEWQYGISWAYKLRMENGDKWEIVKKKENALKVWDELTYELIDGQYWPQFKVQKPAYNRGWNSDKALLITSAMQSAVSLVSTWYVKIDKLESTFDRIYWIMNNANGK